MTPARTLRVDVFFCELDSNVGLRASTAENFAA